MDYPDVTCVVQVGAPDSRYTYIHRLGRTARAGKDKGHGSANPYPYQDLVLGPS